MEISLLAIKFSLLSEFLGPVLVTNQITKGCIKDTFKKPSFVSCKECQNFFDEMGYIALRFNDLCRDEFFTP